tara:strand:+ start:456 stop:836 length:381 start_codon:yes stop_codon:yes gene_type:complete
MNENFKDLSDKDLDSWLRYLSKGEAGAVFFSDSISSLDRDLLEFFTSSQREVDSLVVMGKENTFNEDFIKICHLLPYISFIYQKDKPDEILKYFRFITFYKYKNQVIPDNFQKAFDSLEDCEVKEV